MIVLDTTDDIKYKNGDPSDKINSIIFVVRQRGDMISYLQNLSDSLPDAKDVIEYIVSEYLKRMHLTKGST